jgi:1-acyl-sn-glycerol-3-phosphate acyltransferase
MLNQNTRAYPRNFIQLAALFILTLVGWRVTGRPPTADKYLIIGAPHTSNWDLPLILLVMAALGVNLRWVGKDNLFRGPLGVIFRWLGGIPVNRRQSTNFTGQMIDLYHRHDRLALAIAPEGTRSQAGYWRSGFYTIAYGAQVPVACGFLDYATRTGGFGPTLWPSGDLQADFRRIRRFYTGIQGKYPQNQGQIVLQSEAGQETHLPDDNADLIS